MMGEKKTLSLISRGLWKSKASKIVQVNFEVLCHEFYPAISYSWKQNFLCFNSFWSKNILTSSIYHKTCPYFCVREELFRKPLGFFSWVTGFSCRFYINSLCSHLHTASLHSPSLTAQPSLSDTFCWFPFSMTLNLVSLFFSTKQDTVPKRCAKTLPCVRYS